MTRPEPPRRDSTESIRGLSGAGPSKVGVVKAMRARDVSRPREALDPDHQDRPDGQAEGAAGSSGSSPTDS